MVDSGRGGGRWRDPQERFEHRIVNRRRWVRWGVLIFAVILVVSLPIEIVRYSNSVRQSRFAAVLPVAPFHLGTAPLIVFGPDGRVAARAFGSGSAWLGAIETKACSTVSGWNGDSPRTEVGFVEASSTSPRAIVVTTCPRIDGLATLVAVVASPSRHITQVIVPSSRSLYTARLSASTTAVTVSEASTTTPSGVSVPARGFVVTLR
ncbi:MAG: hypothetical protein ACYDHP_08080 [Ferrimicrobium sp.]